MNQPIPTPPEPQAGATTDEHPATYGFKGPRPGAANLVREYPLPFEVKGDNPPMVVAANGEAILSLMWPVHAQTPEGERAAVDYVAAIAKDVADSLNRKDIPALIATPDLAAIQARLKAAAEIPDAQATWSLEIRGDSHRILAHECRDTWEIMSWDTASLLSRSLVQIIVNAVNAARTDLPALLAALATSRAETEEALKKQPINTSLRLFDLVRYMRSELHQKELITDEEYAELCMGPMAIDRKNGGSPSPRRLEEYDALRAQLATLTATLAQREAEVAEAKRWTKVREEEAEDLRSRAVFKTLADRCYDADRAEMDLFDTINRILGCDVEKCNDEGFKWGITDCWTDDYDGSVEVIRGSEQPELTREQADAILALGFGMIYESPADANTEKPEGIHWTVTSRGWCHPKRRDGENVKLVKMRHTRDTALARVRELEAAMDELKRRLNALETDVYKYQNQCDPEEAIPAYITGEIERISKSASDAAARAAGKGEEGAGV